MLYTDMNPVRCRMNRLADKINEATNYGRRSLPERFFELQREYDALMNVFMNPALLKDGVEIAETPT